MLLKRFYLVSPPIVDGNLTCLQLVGDALFCLLVVAGIAFGIEAVVTKRFPIHKHENKDKETMA